MTARGGRNPFFFLSQPCLSLEKLQIVTWYSFKETPAAVRWRILSKLFFVLCHISIARVDTGFSMTSLRKCLPCMRRTKPEAAERYHLLCNATFFFQEKSWWTCMPSNTLWR